MDILNYGEKKIVSIKKELEKVDLLYQKRVGLNQPNRLYLGKPNATAQDVYLQENKVQSLDTSGTVKKTAYLYKDNNIDTNRHYINTDKDQLQDQMLLDNFVEIMKDDSIATFIPEKVLNLIKTFSPSYAAMRTPNKRCARSIMPNAKPNRFLRNPLFLNI